MTIKSLILTAMVGVGTLTLAGCVDGGGPYYGGGYSGVYVSSFDGPYYGNGYYHGYRRDNYYRDYRRDGRYSRHDDGHRRDNDRPRGPSHDYHRGGGDNGRVIIPNPNTPRGPMFSRGGN